MSGREVTFSILQPPDWQLKSFGIIRHPQMSQPPDRPCTSNRS